MLLLHDGSGSGMDAKMMGSSVTISVNASTDFRVDVGDLDLSGVTVPTFSAETLSKAQEIEIDNDSTTPSGISIDANKIKLEQQSIGGTISNSSSNQFTLTVADDSAFAMLTGVKTVTVMTSSKTDDGDDGNRADSSKVHVRGLLFFNPGQNSYVLLAKRLKGDN
jgi:hypothetical protein